MTEYKLMRIDPETVGHLNSDDECFYLSDYHRVADVLDATKHTPTQLIRNFKKPVDRKGRPEWYYKEKAIAEVSRILEIIYKKIKVNEGIVFCHIPTSKMIGTPDYDDRFEMVHKKLKAKIPSLNFLQPLHIKQAKNQLHHGGCRDINDIKDNYQWQADFPTNTALLIVLDDVITTGATFRAFKDTVLEYIPECRVIGLFIAKYKGE